MHDHGFALGLLFFGGECLVVGYLIVRARYLPSVFGYMMLAAGASYLTNSFALVLYPAARIETVSIHSAAALRGGVIARRASALKRGRPRALAN